MEDDWNWCFEVDDWFGDDICEASMCIDVVSGSLFEEFSLSPGIKRKKEKEVFRPFRSLGEVEFEVKRMRELINKRMSE